MSESCDFKDECIFYAKFHTRQSIAWKGIFQVYCKGKTPFLCERRNYHQDNGSQPSENFLPTGKLVSRAFLALP